MYIQPNMRDDISSISESPEVEIDRKTLHITIPTVHSFADEYMQKCLQKKDKKQKRSDIVI